MNPKTVILSVSLLITLLANGFQLSAESLPERESRRHEVRFGWGDQLFENLIWQNPQAIVDNLPESFSKTYKENYRYSQHWSAEYISDEELEQMVRIPRLGPIPVPRLLPLPEEVPVLSN